jgi:hypothetical protein
MGGVHVMLDLETWGTSPGSALRSVGAVTFSPYGEPGFTEAAFYANIDRHSCVLAGMTIDPAIVDWWSRQAGFDYVGDTRGGLAAFQILPERMPSAWPASARSTAGLPLYDAMAV